LELLPLLAIGGILEIEGISAAPSKGGLLIIDGTSNTPDK
jgi:hypothetical protein